MFTGIVEELGKIESIKNKGGLSYTISSQIVLDDLEIGDSIAVNGVCLTVTRKTTKTFTIQLVDETLNKSNLGDMKLGNKVNLERSMKLSDRFGGHIVQGHIETIGVILDKQVEKNEVRLFVGLDPEWMRFCIPKGSITLDGVSLTIAAINGNIIEIALIPHTMENTTLGIKNKSDTLNIETDIIGKYIDRLLTFEGEDVDIDTNILKAIKHIQYGES